MEPKLADRCLHADLCEGHDTEQQVGRLLDHLSRRRRNG
jgi:hypothetical protein